VNLQHCRRCGFPAGNAFGGKQNGCCRWLLAAAIALSGVTGKNSTHATAYAHPTLVISSPANIAAPSLWREMDKFAPPTPYANHHKKVLLNRHKTGREDEMINSGK
jgi:hypothetical protein